ncbi:MAG: hypothetical protein IKS13_10790 [Ruminococcus sp.]|nr:hypothetical protein [Ruminococcus sp.]
MIIFYLLPLLMIIFCCKAIFNIIKLKRKCTESVYAVVIDIDKEAAKSQAYGFPVYGIDYNGERYIVRGNFSSPSLQFDIEEQVEMYVDPNDPKKYYCPKEAKPRLKSSLIFLIFSIIIFLLPLLA